MTRTKTRGACALCGYESSKAGVTRHLKSCPGAHDSATGKATKLRQIRVADAYSSLYWLDLEIKESATFADLDVFLREVWLECCGHLSAFELAVGDRERHRYTVDYPLGDPDWQNPDERTMNVKVGEVLSPGLKFTYEYDFGSTTELTLEVRAERAGQIGRAPLRLLARNDAPSWPCRACGEAATQVDTEAMYDEESPFYCDRHAEAQGDEGMFLPVVNSPRMGVCAYTGPEG